MDKNELNGDFKRKNPYDPSSQIDPVEPTENKIDNLHDDDLNHVSAPHAADVNSGEQPGVSYLEYGPEKPEEIPVSLGLGNYPTVIRKSFIKLLLLIYVITVLCFGYWYWMRPVRADQFKSAIERWQSYAAVYDVPYPKDERWQ